MMNQKTRHLSKMPDEVRAEISPWFIEKRTIIEDTPEKIKKLDDTAKHATSSLKVNYFKVLVQVQLQENYADIFNFSMTTAQEE